MSRARIVFTVALVAAVAGACGGSDRVDDVSIEELRSRVSNTRASVEARLATNLILGDSGLAPSNITLRLSTPLLRRTLEVVAASYLEDVYLDLEPNAVVRLGDNVHVRIGPINANAGRWDLEITILRIQASLGARSPETSVDDEGRLRIKLVAEVLGGSGDARIHFKWDAAALTSVVCGGFEIDETFAATVAPRSYTLNGIFDIALDGTEFAIAPRFEEQIHVQPEPTEESWRRVREILEEQDSSGNCGLALNPESLERTLRDLVQKGFQFRLPDSVLRPVTLPLGVGGDLVVSGQGLRASVSPAGLKLTPGWLWYGIDVALERADVPATR